MPNPTDILNSMTPEASAPAARSLTDLADEIGRTSEIFRNMSVTGFLPPVAGTYRYGFINREEYRPLPKDWQPNVWEE